MRKSYCLDLLFHFVKKKTEISLKCIVYLYNFVLKEKENRRAIKHCSTTLMFKIFIICLKYSRQRIQQKNSYPIACPASELNARVCTGLAKKTSPS